MMISRDMSLRLRGLAILLICLHNLLHLDCYVMECEFAFMDYRVDRLERCFSFTSASAVEIFFSFFGWYGVPLFMFMSGYGLSAKYERMGQELRPWTYLWRHFVKLWWLMAPAYLVFLAVDAWANGEVPDALTWLSQLTLTHNFWDVEDINPGVYWYFGLTMQFYVWYLLFYYRRSSWMLGVFFVASLLVAEYFALVEPASAGHFLLRHNSPLWLSVFLMGVAASRYCDSAVVGVMTRHRWWLIPLVVLLWVYTSVHVEVWVLSPLLSVVLLLLVCAGGDGGGVLRYVGVVSAGVFVCHPILRVLARPLIQQRHEMWLVSLVYVLACVLLATLYIRYIFRLASKNEKPEANRQ